MDSLAMIKDRDATVEWLEGKELLLRALEAGSKPKKWLALQLICTFRKNLCCFVDSAEKSH
jgi:hypothetical protein